MRAMKARVEAITFDKIFHDCEVHTHREMV